MAYERMESVRGDEEETDRGGACSLYEPGRHDTVRDAEHATWKTVRRCKRCDCLEEDHDEPEPANSTRQTIVPGAPDHADDLPAVLRTPEQLACLTIEGVMGGPAFTHYDRLLLSVEAHLGRAANAWERRALRSYLGAVAVDVLTRARP